MPSSRHNAKAFEELQRRLGDVSELSAEERKKILASRAKALAEQQDGAEQLRVEEVVAFRVGGERYAVPISRVDEILEIKGLCPLVGAPNHVLGAIVARSRVLAVLDLRQMLGLQGGGMTDLTKVVAISEGDDLFGLAVEDVEGKLDLPAQQGPPKVAGPFLLVTNDRLAVLDIAQLTSPLSGGQGKD